MLDPKHFASSILSFGSQSASDSPSFLVRIFDPLGWTDPPPWVYPKRAATILEPSWPPSWAILGPLGPSSAYLGPLLQPTCSSTSLLGTLMPKLTAHKIQLASFADCFGLGADMLRKCCCRLLLHLKLQRPIFKALGLPTLNPWKLDSNSNVSARTCTRHDKLGIQA